MNARDILKYGHLTVLNTIAAFPANRVIVRGAVGYWSVKDVVAHLGSYELVLVEVLGSVLEPCPTPLAHELAADGQAFNDHQVDVLRRDRTMDEVMTEYSAAYEQVGRLAARVPLDEWRRNGVLPWYGPEYDLEDFIAYTYYGHKREHCGQIQVFRDRVEEAAANFTGPAPGQP